MSDVGTEATKTERREAPKIERRLAAIVFADVAGFSRLMEQDEVQTMLRWRNFRHDLLQPKVAEHRGRLIRIVGDALFLEFQSAVDAVTWAQDVQRFIGEFSPASEEDVLKLRIGINVDDVIVDEDDLHGDGVNIAARIQQLASPGEIIVTESVRDYIRNKLSVEFHDLGEQVLKNIRRPVRVYRLGASARPAEGSGHVAPYLAWTNRPAIAVLPFRNLSGNPQEEYFGEGIVEDIISSLSRSRSLFVIARNSTLAYRDRRVDERQIGAELGVRFILDGSVRRQQSLLRIDCKLVETTQKRVIWADRFDGPIEELFDFQDGIAKTTVAMIEGRVYEAETERVLHKPTESLDAYDLVLRSLQLLYTFKDADLKQAQAYLDRAIVIDPRYAQAHAYKAWLYVLLIGEEFLKNGSGDVHVAEQAAQQALALDPKDAFVLAVAAHVESFLCKRPEAALELFERALLINESSAFAWGMSAATYAYLGSPDQALERLRNAWRLSPFDPLNFVYCTVAGIADFIAGRLDQAVTWLRKARRENPRFRATHRTLTSALAHLGRLDEAGAAAKDLLELEPDFRVSAFASWYPLRRPADLERLVEGLRVAGLPD
jgi:adenylate cyclase